MFDGTGWRTIDLTLPVYHGMRGVEIHPHTGLENDGYNTTNLMLYSHSGTHMDAPLHFLAGGDTIENTPLQKCVGTAVTINLTHKPPNSLIAIADLQPYANKIGLGSRLLLRTDWDLYADKSDYRTSFPRISLELAEWLGERGIWLLGLESPSVASLQDREELTAVHQALLRHDIVIVESLANLRQLPDEVILIALPLKIQGGDGSPVRAMALVRDE
ncbi:MAG: cyclase family protein [Chloroflexi bacterium]|nr:MAG: cyclase family protein [Chloroflexota bacterium]